MFCLYFKNGATDIYAIGGCYMHGKHTIIETFPIHVTHYKKDIKNLISN